MQPKLFRQEEASALIPILNLEFEKVSRLRSEIAELTERLGGADRALQYLEGKQRPPPALVIEAQQIVKLTDDVRKVILRVTELGCVIKDLELGLVDFYGRREGRVVFFCWQFGEPAVEHWHELDEGFQSRQRLAAAKRREVLN